MIDNPGHATIHIPTETRGTGEHQHHRGWIEHRGVRVGFWVCKASPHDDRHCADEPDPWEVMAGKVKAARARRAPDGPRPFCEVHPPERWRTYSGNRLCLDCRSAQRRTERIAARIARDAVRVA